jgi:hypothetical protein
VGSRVTAAAVEAHTGFEPVLGENPDDEPSLFERLIGVGPMSAGWVNDVTKIRDALKGKNGRYDTLDSPFVIAVMPTWPESGLETATEVLYGREAVQIDLETDVATAIRRPDGFFLGEARAVSAVLLGGGVLPWTAGDVWPRLWLNPNADHPLPADVLPDVPRVRVGADGRLIADQPSEPPARLLDISSAAAHTT